MRTNLRSQSFSRNENGFTLAELMLSTVVLIIILLALASAVSTVHRDMNTAITKRAKNLQVSSIIDNIRDSVVLHQIYFDPDPTSSTVGAALDPNNLPLAWDNNVLTSASACPDCLGRAGYTIQPLDTFGGRGLYYVRIRVTHKTLINTPTGYEEYEFVVGTK
jgi:type II secretory pathway pseudopilin PulG